MRFKTILLTLIFSTVCLSNESEYNIDRLDWGKFLDKGSTVSVENLYGNILIKKSYSQSFSIHAVNQNHNSKNNKAQFLIEEKDNNISIKIAFDKDHLIEKERSDISLIMPKGLHLSIIMDTGKLTAKKIINPITITAESAQIYLTTKSQFNVSSNQGDIFVKILDNSKPQSSSIQSYKGDITLQYLVDKPYIDVISGKTVVSNSAELLSTKKQSQRHVLFNNPKSETKINIKNDTGNVILIDKNNK